MPWIVVYQPQIKSNKTGGKTILIQKIKAFLNLLFAEDSRVDDEREADVTNPKHRFDKNPLTWHQYSNNNNNRRKNYYPISGENNDHFVKEHSRFNHSPTQQHRKNSSRGTPAHLQYLQRYHRGELKYSDSSIKEQEKLIRQNNQALEDALLVQSGLSLGLLSSSPQTSSGSRKRRYGEAISNQDIAFREIAKLSSSPCTLDLPHPRRSEHDMKRVKKELHTDDSPLTFQEKCSMYLETIRGSSKTEKKNPVCSQSNLTSDVNELASVDFMNKNKDIGTELDARDISDTPLDLCTSPKNSISGSPCRQSSHHNQQSPINLLMQSHDETEIRPPDCRSGTKDRESPVLVLATDSPASDCQDKVEKKPERPLTGRKSIDRKPSPIDLSRSTRSEELEKDGFAPSLLAQFPGLRAGGSSLVSYDGRTINTPDVVGKKSPSDTNNSFFPSSMVMTPSPMVGDAISCFYFSAL